MAASMGATKAAAHAAPQTAATRTVVRDVVWLGIGVTVLLVYWFAGVNGRVDEVFSFGGSDLSFQFLPDYAALAERLRAGELAQWNPMQGQPFLATLLPAAFYPARLLLVVFDVPTAMHVSTVLHLVLSLAATFALCRALGTGVFGALLGAAVYVGIHALPSLYWPPFLEGGTWLPVAGFALTRLAATAAFGWALALGLAMGLFVLAGTYQHAIYATYALAALGLALLADPARRGRLATPAMAARLGVAGLVAVATAAPQALPTLAWSAETVRSGTALTDVQIDPFPWPRVVWNLMFPGWGQENLMAVTIPVALLALLGCVVQQRFGAVLLAATVASILLCLGRGTPAFALFHVLPGFSSFRLPDRLIFLVAFFSALGAALGADYLVCRGRVARAAAVIGFVAVAWNLFAPRRIVSALPWTVPAESLGGPPALMALVERYTDGGRTLLTGTSHVDGISIKHPGMHHVRNLEDYNPLSSRRLAAYLNALVGKPPPRPEDVPLFIGFLPMNERITRPELLDMASVRTVLIRGVDMPPRLPPFRPLGREQKWTLYENPLAFPRAFTIERARFVPDDAAALDVVRAPDFDARQEVVLASTPQPDEAAALRAGPAGSLREARIVHDAAEHVTVEVRSDRPGVVVLTDPFAPGWSATVNGHPARVLAANYLGRGVLVPAGESRVEFVYRAPGLRAGFAVALLGWGAVAASVVLRTLRFRATSSRYGARGIARTPPSMP
jgi:Bacterial membrane protein YfhO